MSYYRILIIKENMMSVKLQPNMTQNARDLRICEDYWSYYNQSDYIGHVKTVVAETSPLLSAIFLTASVLNSVL